MCQRAVAPAFGLAVAGRKGTVDGRKVAPFAAIAFWCVIVFAVVVRVPPPFPQFNVEVLCPDGTGVVTGSYPLPCRMEKKLHHFVSETERCPTTQH